MKTGKPGAQTDQTRTTVEITAAALEDVVGIQDVLYRSWLATYPSEMFGINVDDIEEMYKDAQFGVRHKNCWIQKKMWSYKWLPTT